MIEYQRLDIPPETSQLWVTKYNTNNRKVRPKRVAQIAEDMRLGKFVVNGDPIRFDSNGNLMDGQHRLLAAVRAGYTFKDQLVIFGLPPEASETIDCGAARTDADRLKMAGVANSKVISTAAKIILCYDSSDLTFKTSPRHTAITEYGKAPSVPLQEWVSKARSIGKAVGGSDGIILAFLALSGQYDKAKTEAFVEGVITGAGLEADSPVLAFRNYSLRNFAANKGRRTAGWVQQSQIIIKTLNAYHQGRKIKLLHWGEDDNLQDLFFRKVLPSKGGAKNKEKQAVPAPLADLLKDTGKKSE